MADIFISYAREDLERVRPIVGAIEGSGYSVFWDRRIPSGMTWRQYIGNALNEAKCVVVVWSQHAIVSKFVIEEADDGNEREILVPVLIDEVKPPLGFRSIQCEDFRGWNGDTDHRRLKSLLNSIERATGRKATRKKPPLQGKTNPDYLRGESLIESIKRFIVRKPAHKKPLFQGGIDLATLGQRGTKRNNAPHSDGARMAITNEVDGYELVKIPAGRFMMGSPESEKDRFDREGPRHEVHVPAFFMGRYPVTNAQYELFLKKNPKVSKPRYWANRQFNQARQPVVGVSWEDAQAYARWAGLRLPTEAEWEYACRAGARSRFYTGDKDADLGWASWYGKNAKGNSHPVGEKEPNAFGLYDMHGNVWEWVEDDWHDNYDGAPLDGQAWIDNPRAAARVIRGGSWNYDARDCRSASRDYDAPEYRRAGLGFRLARSVALGP